MTKAAAAAKENETHDKWQCAICGRRIGKALALTGWVVRHFKSHYPELSASR